jgi:hypothetical protein
VKNPCLSALKFYHFDHLAKSFNLKYFKSGNKIDSYFFKVYRK